MSPTPRTPEPSDRGCAVGQDGKLLDASHIAFYNSPSDEHPIQVPDPNSPKPSVGPTVATSIAQGRSRRAKPAKFIAALIAEKGSISGDEVAEEDLGAARTGKEKLKSGPKIKIKLPSASAENSGAPSTTTTTTTAHVRAVKTSESVTAKQGVSSKAPATGRVRDNKTEATCESTDVEDIVEVGAKHAGEKRPREDSNPRQKGANKSTTTKVTDRPKKRMRRKSRTNAEQAGVSMSERSDLDSGSESDGLGALRTVEAMELKENGRNGVRGPENKTLQHWHEPKPTLDRSQKEPYRWEFGCRYCSAIRTFPRTKGVELWEKEHSRPVLGNLATHTKRHEAKLAAAPSNEPPTAHHSTHGFTAASAKLMEGYLKEGALNPRIVPTQSGFLKMFAAWLLEDDLAWTTGESPGLIRLFKYMQINFMLPSDTTVRNTVARICQDLHKTIVQELASVKSKISYSQDTWTTKQMVFSFCGVIASFIDDDWSLIERLIDFRRLNPEDHKGKDAARAFIRSARKRGRLNMITLTMDNATSNDVLARSLATLLIKHNVEFDAKSGQIRCLPHVINLVVQRILSKLSSGDVADPDINDYYEQAKKHSVHYDPNSDPDVQEMEEEYLDDENEGSLKADSSDEDELSDSDSDIELPGLSTRKAPIAKLRHIVTKIVSSPQRRYAFRQQVRKFYENLRLMVIRDVKTRWNCTHAMIKRALILQNAINAWVLSIPELHPYALTKSDWKVLAATEELLQPFTDITRDMSQSGTPTLCYAIPFYRRMKKHLTASSENSQLTSLGGFQDAIVAGLAKLETYYDKALSNEFNIIATACHPSFRLDWFQKIDMLMYKEARNVVKRKYDEYRQQRLQPPTAPSTPTKAGTSKQSQLSLALGSPIKLPVPTDTRPSGDLEWHRWCSGEGGGNLERPLLWWKEHAAEFPVMALVARDFLAIQGSAVSVERLFSSSRHLCTDVRSSMKAKTITQAMCAKMWIKQGLLKV